MAIDFSEKGSGSWRPTSSRDDLTEVDATQAAAKETRPEPEKLDLKKTDSKVATPPKAENLDDLFKHLPPHQAEILRRQVVSPEVKQGVTILYRYSSRNDIIIIAISAICAIAAGAALPLMTVVFGNLQGVFGNYSIGGQSYDDFTGELAKYVLYFVYLGVGEFVTTYIATVGFIYTGEHISAKIREHYLESCMRQNIGFFDKLGAGEVTTRITWNSEVSLTLVAVATFISAFVIGFVKYWKLTLILLSIVIALLLNMGGGSTFIMKYNKQNLEAYAHGGSLANEVISSIRNAVAFGTQDRLARQYDKHLGRAEFFGFRVKAASSCMIAGMMLVLYLNYSLAFWQGSKPPVDGETPLPNIPTIPMSVIISAFNLGTVAPNLQAFTNAVAAAVKIFNTIDRVSPLDPTNDDGEKLDHLEGSIRLSNIKHIYPSRPDVVVMNDVSLEIPAGKTTAVVGASGSGKSTIVGLVERFHDPVDGAVYLDGHDISKLNLRWFREQMALVSQEPTLFGTTIFHNIRYGLIGTKHEHESEEKQRELVIEAAKKANAHDFVSRLPEGYETHVGERGFLLSGGQRQRIAIARAVVSDPKSLSGVTLGTILMVLTTLISAIALALAVGRKLSLVCISTIPVLLGCGFFRFWMLAHFQRRSKAAYDLSATFASEAISAIRTVATLTREQDVLQRYKDSLAEQQRHSLILVIKSAALYAASQSLVFACFALGFWYGGTLISKFEYDIFQFFLCFMAIIFGAQSAGTIFSFAPDMGKAYQAAGELKKLFNRIPVVDTWSTSGDRLTEVEGTLEFRDVHFRYPTRPEQPVLREYDYCATGALLRPLSGGVYIDGHEVSGLNINDYRSHIALVSQEPTLYQGSVKENIPLGTPKEGVSDEAIEFACREANIYDFIISLPDGFNTVVGSKGALLSGGQKQRIAIARALIRDPKILLLDEATSALDSESEYVVQAALDKAAKGRTTIAVAHRLSTVQKAAMIYVFDQGRITEQGTHSELMKKNGRYAELVNLQSLEKHT
ncbi:ATP-binding cassette, subfamily B (MDR/TAP), member 1 [Fusarium oxysporum f. sp. melonis 26406]|uniref:ATP-binding cassette, subfamily B (MDR/TAP), member 1 n=1 Tax=Fusarium oxysporum f. sp. melonis 26406 TaxID=1089452 RepID=X0A1B4_FUSOX|nr:ATP-binding cassette, subfamily B (MDR/TAP), member 1 [Fusarium oxysporum f. sp. melonis 26406]